eukprot:COSAG02_NODE_404_length_23022_cov_305.366008_15_plen_340_part_00
MSTVCNSLLALSRAPPAPESRPTPHAGDPLCTAVRKSESMAAKRVALLVGILGGRGEPQSAPALGEPCHGCICGGVDLRNYSGHEFRTPPDADGYIYMFQMCDEIPQSRLPQGCQLNGLPALPHPAVIKYKASDTKDCSLLGSFGPCEGVECSMTYLPSTRGTPFSVTWRFQYGCKNTFRIYLEDGQQTQPEEAPYNDPSDQYPCYWTSTWHSLQAFGPPSPPSPCSQTPDCPDGEYCDFAHNCYHCSYLTEKCDALGGDCCSETFLRNCPSNPLAARCDTCTPALVKACNTSRSNVFNCARCSGINQHILEEAGCTNDEIARWCARPRSPPPRSFQQQ